MTEKHSDLCVGGPLDGKRFAAARGSGFRVPIREPLPDPVSIDYRPNATVKVVDERYRSESFNTPQGSVTFWVPSDQTPLETITRLLKVYEKERQTIVARNDEAMRMARDIVEDHIRIWGMVPSPDKMKERIASALRSFAKPHP